MKQLVSLLRWLYARCLRLYPRSYGEAYGEEMQAVFNLALDDALARGGLAVTAMVARELAGLPGAIYLAHRRERRKRKMLAKGKAFLTFERGSRREAFSAMAPFLLLGALPALISYLNLALFSAAGALRWLETVLLFGALGPVVVLLILGLIRGFPRWVLPYLGLPLALFSVYIFFNFLSLSHLAARLHSATSNETIRQLSFQLAQLHSRTTPLTVRQVAYQGQLWLGLPIATVASVIICALLPPLRPFYRRLRQDWTLLSFLLYGATWFAVLLTFDDYPQNQPYKLLAMLLLAAGGWFYLRGGTRRRRFVSLLAGWTLAMIVATVGKAILYVGPDWPYPRTISIFTWQSEATSTMITWAWLLLALATPALLAFLPRKSPARRPSP